MELSLKARQPIDVDSICNPFGSDMLDTCLDFLTVYGKTLLKKISRGEEDVCANLYDRNLLSVLLGTANYLCADQNNHDDDDSPQQVIQETQKEIKVPREQAKELNMNFLLHIEVFQSTHMERVEDSKVMSSSTVLQESETTFFQDPNGDVWREDHTQIFKTNRNSQQVAFFDLYNVEKITPNSNLEGFMMEGNQLVIESVEMKSEKVETPVDTEPPQNQKVLAFVVIQTFTFLLFITLFFSAIRLFKSPSSSHSDSDSDSDSNDKLLIDYDTTKNEKNSTPLLILQNSLIQDDKKEFAFFYPQSTLILIDGDAL